MPNLPSQYLLTYVGFSLWELLICRLVRSVDLKHLIKRNCIILSNKNTAANTCADTHPLGSKQRWALAPEGKGWHPASWADVLKAAHCFQRVSINISDYKPLKARRGGAIKIKHANSQNWQVLPKGWVCFLSASGGKEVEIIAMA